MKAAKSGSRVVIKFHVGLIGDMSSERRDFHVVAPTSVMSVGQIQRQDLFDDEDDDDIDIDRSAAAAPVPHTDVANVYSGAIETRDSNCASGAGCASNGCQCRHVLTMVLLTGVNLINYMDRFSVAGLF